MTKEEFKAKVSMAYHGFYPDREEWERFLEDMWQLHLQAASHWISVEDELPEENKCVLTYNGSSINLLMLASNGNWYDHSVAQHRNVTHWIALPSPPEHFADVSKKISGSSGIPNNHTKTIEKGGEQ